MTECRHKNNKAMYLLIAAVLSFPAAVSRMAGSRRNVDIIPGMGIRRYRNGSHQVRGNARRPFRHARRIQKLANSTAIHYSLLPIPCPDDTATVYYNYRHYEPVTGRWMQRDPVKQFANSYEFCENCVSHCYDWIGLESVPITYTYGYQDARMIGEISYRVNRRPCPDGGVSIDRIHLELSPNEFSTDKDFLQNLQVVFIRNLEVYDLPIPFKLLDVDFEAQGEVVDSSTEQSGNCVRRCIKERFWIEILERGLVFEFYIFDWAPMEHKYQLGNSAFVTVCGPWCCKEAK